MKNLLPAVLLLATVAYAYAQDNPAATPTVTPGIPAQVEVYFSPKGGCTDAVVKAIDGAKTEILVQAYSFTSAPIAKALVDAHKHGINVRVILDKSERTEKFSSATFLSNAGIDTWIDGAHATAHNKVMIIDGRVVITGSFNFTKKAENSNAENLLVIRSQELAQKYVENWEKHLGHSERFEGKVDQ